MATRTTLLGLVNLAISSLTAIQKRDSIRFKSVVRPCLPRSGQMQIALSAEVNCTIGRYNTDLEVAVSYFG